MKIPEKNKQTDFLNLKIYHQTVELQKISQEGRKEGRNEGRKEGEEEERKKEKDREKENNKKHEERI